MSSVTQRQSSMQGALPGQMPGGSSSPKVQKSEFDKAEPNGAPAGPADQTLGDSNANPNQKSAGEAGLEANQSNAPNPEYHQPDANNLNPDSGVHRAFE